MTEPQVFVCAGGGGVGKTTASAALALATARSKKRTLVVTVDPARRLAQAMGVPIDPTVNEVQLEGEPEGMLYALMPEPRHSTRTFVRLLFAEQPEAYARIVNNRIYAALGDALAGVHELVSLMLVAQAVEEHSFDVLVVDTAPSRYALDFVTYPGRLASLFEGRAVAWFGNLAQKARAQQEGEPPPEDETGLVAWGKKRVEAALARILDPRTILDVTSLFAELALVRHRFASLARQSEALLLGPSARYLIVAAPTGAAEADVGYIAERLQALKQRPRAVFLNRADDEPPSWVRTLQRAEGVTLPVQQAVSVVMHEHEARKRAGDAMETRFSKTLRRTEILRLPNVEAQDPSDVVRTLADRLQPELATLLL